MVMASMIYGKLEVLKITNAIINIYNRWGQLVFKSTSNYKGNEWDGTYNGTPLPFAVYYYTIDPINENCKTYNGGVTIKY